MNMKKNNLCVLVIALFALSFFYSCSSEDDLGTHENEKKQAFVITGFSTIESPAQEEEIDLTQAKKISNEYVDFENEEPVDNYFKNNVTTRAGFIPKLEGSKQVGVNVKYNVGEEYDLYTIIKQGNNSCVPAVTKLKIIKDLGNYKYNCKFEVKVENFSGIDTSKPFSMAGAIGVGGINKEGKAQISWDKPIKTNRDNYVVPSYFKETPVTITSDGKASIFVNMKQYGSLLEVDLKSELYDPFVPRELIVQTEAMSNAGNMDLLNLDKDGEPIWKYNGTLNDKKTYQLDLGVVKGKRPDLANYDFEGTVKDDIIKSIFVWMMPNENSTGKLPFLLSINDNPRSYGYDPIEQGLPIMGRYKVKFKKNKSYKLPAIITSDLIISAAKTTPAYGQTNSWAFYNPTSKPIDLSQYYFISDRCGKRADKKQGVWCQLFTPGKSEKIYTWKGLTKKEKEDQKHYLFLYQKSPLDGEGRYLLPGMTLIVENSNDAYPTSILGKIISQGVTQDTKTRIISKNTTVLIRKYEGAGWQQTESNSGAFGNSTGTQVGLTVWKLCKGGHENKNLIDVFGLRYDPLECPYIGYYAHFRKPDRNFPRKFWYPITHESDNDWVWGEQAKFRYDASYRFKSYSEWTGTEYKNHWETRYTLMSDNHGISYNWAGGGEYKIPGYWDIKTRH